MHLDHWVLTVGDVTESFAFYVGFLGLKPAYTDGRLGFKAGRFLIKVHLAGSEIQPHARLPRPGSADICFISDQSMDWWETRLKRFGIDLELGPVTRSGAAGPIQSIYLRDPDGNLIEIANAWKSLVTQGAEIERTSP